MVTPTMSKRTIFAAFLGTLLALGLAACDRNSASPATTQPTGTLTPVRLTLDWKPEPEFGGFYEAQRAGTFTNSGLQVEIQSAGGGAPIWQLVDRGSTDFATTSGDEVLIARARGADVVAIFAVYQTFPQAIMVHEKRGLSSIADVFTQPGTLAAESNPWLTYLLKKNPNPRVNITGYSGGIAAFLSKPDFSQQCFVTSEPILARRQGADVQTFLIADAGYNPYTTVVITAGKTLRERPKVVSAMVAACRQGWRDYLDNPAPANAVMAGLNQDMDVQTFAEAAAAQKGLIETGATRQAGLGSMTSERWQTLSAQLVELGALEKAAAPAELFVTPGNESKNNIP